MNVDFLFLLAQQQQAGGGVTWTMTAGPRSGGAGYTTDGGGTGSISNEPIPSAPLVNQLSSSNTSNTDALLFSGTDTSLLSPFSELVINGTAYRVQTPFTFSTFLLFQNWPDGFPTYVNGVTYNCELR